VDCRSKSFASLASRCALLAALTACAGCNDRRPDPTQSPPQQNTHSAEAESVAEGEPGDGEGSIADWSLLYWMPYDNNLSIYADPILDGLAHGIESSRVRVAVQADRDGPGGMLRFAITDSGWATSAVSSEASASVTAFRDFLDWAVAEAPAERYAVILLGHGGRLSEVFADDHPGDGSAHATASLTAVGEAITAWRADIEGSVELLFLQQCDRGSIENYYAVRAAARFVMGSQTGIAAPNSYYTGLTRHLSSVESEPVTSGSELGRLIARFEGPEMYNHYTVVDSAVLEELPSRLDAVLAPLTETASAVDPLSSPLVQSAAPAPDERFYDAVNWLDERGAPVSDFRTWAQSALIRGHYVSPLRIEVHEHWRGLSMYVPLTRAALTRYADYELYRDSLLDEALGHLIAFRP